MRRARHSRPSRRLPYKITIAVLVLLGALLFAGQFGLIGFRALTVQSGSMEPTIDRNSLVLTRPVTALEVNDIVTYELADAPDLLITHRIVELQQAGGETLYVTKGDANDAVDGEPVSVDAIIGQVWLTIPWIGIFVNWLRSDIGFLMLIVIPATIIVYHEVLALKDQMMQRRLRRRARHMAPSIAQTAPGRRGAR